jgi:GT2 family glycosyltransferase
MAKNKYFCQISFLIEGLLPNIPGLDLSKFMKTVAIVILNYNGQGFLAQFLPTVIAHAENQPIYVADNASTDGSVEWLQKNHPDVKCIVLPTNTGYAGGYNRALAQIEADYYVLLNSDVEVTPNWISPVVNLMESDPQIAACQPKIRAFHQKNQFEYAGAAGGYLDWLGFAFCRGRIFDDCEIDQGQYDSNTAVFWATGACLFIKAEVFHQIGGFDDDFFAHMEEIDLCWRLHRAGHSVYSCGDAVVYHVGGGTLPVTSPFKTYLNYRNSLAMLYKNLPSQQLWSVIVLRLLIDGVSAARFLPAGQWRNIWAVVRAHFAFYGQLPQLQQKRKLSHKTLNKYPTLYPKSIVWQYFGKKIKKFSSLPDR